MVGKDQVWHKAGMLAPLKVAPPEHTVGHVLALSGNVLERRQIISFALRDSSILSPLLATDPLPAVAELAYDLQNIPRKVSGEPYFKHVLRTVVLTTEAAAETGLPVEDTVILAAAAYLHDAIELQRQQATGYGPLDLATDLILRGMDQASVWRTVSLVDALTPVCEGKVFTDDHVYMKHKTGTFRDKFTADHPDQRLLRLLKSADLTANIEETIDDLLRGMEDSRMQRPLELRMEIFDECIRTVMELDPHNPLLPRLHQQMDRYEQVRERAKPFTASDRELMAWQPVVEPVQ